MLPPTKVAKEDEQLLLKLRMVPGLTPLEIEECYALSRTHDEQ